MFQLLLRREGRHVDESVVGECAAGDFGPADPQVVACAQRGSAREGRAQLSLMESRAFRHPFYWSPYLLISDWL